MHVYLDASAIIHVIEGTSPQRDVVIDWIQKAVSAGQAVTTSSLSRLECRVKPLRSNDMVVLDLYNRFFAHRRMNLHDIMDDVIEQATGLRAVYGFKTPDAIHLATAILAGAETVVTADVAFRRCPRLRVEII